MKALVRDRFGPPDVIRLEEIEPPELEDDSVLVKVHAASLNRADWYSLTGTPWISRLEAGVRRPKERRLGVDFAGVVEAVGRKVTGLSPGDEVYGGRTGALAEYVSAQNAVVRKPANLTFEEAAAVPVAAITALQGLRDKADVQPGQHVLINGASGGVGHFAVQIAKALGAEVTAVCSPRNVEQACALGADHVFDYTREDFSRSGERYHVLFDNAGSRSWRAYRRVLTSDATVLLVGGPKKNRLLGPIGHVAACRVRALGSGRTLLFYLAKLNKPDLVALSELIEAGSVRPAVERTYELRDAAAAFAYMGEGHARGKVVVRV